TPTARTALVGVLHPPTPTPTPRLSPGDTYFLWKDSVPWGTLLVDGHPGPDVRTSGVRFDTTGEPINDPPYSFTLPRGRHTLEYRAAPFPTLRCVLSVPAARSDTCPLDHNVPLLKRDETDLHTRYVDLQATPDRLPTEQWVALTAATQKMLSQM